MILKFTSASINIYPVGITAAQGTVSGTLRPTLTYGYTHLGHNVVFRDINP